LSKYTLKDAINEHMPFIDELLGESNIPVFKRFIQAASIFVDVAIVDSSFETKEELFKSKAYFEGILPLVNDWYWEKYGQLAKNPKDNVYSGILSSYAQPILIKIPATTSRIEVKGESSWLTFPDCLQSTEILHGMLEPAINLKKLTDNERAKFNEEANQVVSLTRSINLNVMSATDLDSETRSMAVGIWSHFEKAVSDILSFQHEIASIGCWELHLAIEKSFKIFLKQKSGKKHTGHDLMTLSNKSKKYVPDIDVSLISELPSDKEAINLRYAEIIRTTHDAVKYYKNTLLLVDFLTSNLDRNYRFNNASFLIKMAPWAK
jgi:hypothetical protein